MNINNIIKASAKPKIFEKGTSVMWTDEYISKQLLDVHLNKDLDLASRKHDTISKTIEWILNKVENKTLKILDLGCGPGLYTEILAKRGHIITGVDFSKNSIKYAKQKAKEKKLDIEYINKNYLNLKLEENKYDLVIMIFTDFGVLNPTEREGLLSMIHKTLKSGGIFIFDVLNDKNPKAKLSPKNWEVTKKGFWKDKPYLAASESFLFEDEKVVLYQHIVIDDDDIEIYRFWTSLFSNSDLENILSKYSFRNFRFFDNIIPANNNWDGENVTFCVTKNNK